MSGGFFTYNKSELEDIKQTLSEIIDKNEFSSETIEKFKEAIELIELTLDKIKQFDYLLSGDIGEETFNKDWSPVIIEKRLSVKSIENLNNSIVGDIVETELGKLEVCEAHLKDSDSCYGCIMYEEFSTNNCNNKLLCTHWDTNDGKSHVFKLVENL